MIIAERADGQGTIAKHSAVSGSLIRPGGNGADPRNERPTNLMSEVPTSNQLRVLVPMDFSESARSALQEALRLAHQPKDAVFLFYVPGI